MKKNRQEKMLELISRYEIETQDELIDRLREHGYDVTQATVSRDIRELKIAKMTTGRGTYRYVLPKHPQTGTGMRFSATLVDSIISVDYACNMVVLKTYPGLANAVAVGIDGMNMQQILGCVAGDDTIMIVTRDEEAARMISDRLHDLLKNI
ncbi:MAG: arginine repressor [Clostridia bacterium]|jgi:transcriptional regulator of arginine metabolism|nr:arginine repressor [Clostridia bacterium]MBQ1963621.1 arginine repressor [Clostridia bacterium]MBQ5834134.1 arginine repressor [Clostridia bacterium]